jgi:hypothetical protein
MGGSMPSGPSSLRTRLLPRGPLDLAGQLALFAVAYYAYRVTRGWIDDPQGAAVAFQNARGLIHIEQSLGIFVEPSVQAWADARPAILDLASWTYLNAQTSVTLGALAFLYLFHNRNFPFVRNMFLVALGVALVGYAVLPTAPPRFFPEWGFSDTVSDFVGVDHENMAIDALFNPYAAVPSMHIAFSLMIAVPLARLCHHRAARIAWSAYPLLILFVIVATGNHFFSDAFLGAVTAGAGALVAERMGRARPAAWAFAQVEQRA